MAAGKTYESISTTTLSTAQANVTFSSIPATYTDLVLVSNCGGSSSDYIQIVLNSDSGNTLYSGTYLLGSGSSIQSGRYTSGTGSFIYWIGGSTSTGTTSTGIVAVYNFQNYSNTTTYKTVLSKAANSGNTVGVQVGVWRNTAAINSIQIKMAAGANIVSGSTFTLYGITAA